jgi:hypothetical protein
MVRYEKYRQLYIAREVIKGKKDRDGEITRDRDIT